MMNLLIVRQYNTQISFTEEEKTEEILKREQELLKEHLRLINLRDELVQIEDRQIHE